jgi:hypothetical protein
MTVNKNETPVAQDIVAMCTKCKLELNHIVVIHNTDGFVERVKCHTCGSEHKYRPPKEKTPRKTPAKTVDPAIEFEKLAEKFKDKEPVPYSMSGSFKNNDVIQHKTFGMGIVTNVFYQKIEVAFSGGPRLLATGRS